MLQNGPFLKANDKINSAPKHTGRIQQALKAQPKQK